MDEDNKKEFVSPKADFIIFDDVIVTSEFSDPNLDPNDWN